MERWSTAVRRITGKLLLGTALLSVAPVLMDEAFAANPPTTQTPNGQIPAGSVAKAQLIGFHDQTGKFGWKKWGKAREVPGGPHLQCVSFARAASGIDLKGNAANWWNAAAGIYERGHRPEPGSVLNFRSTGQMRMGHVAVVTAVLDSRQIEVDHANWASRGGVSRGIQVIDVSNANDWSAVRVALGHSGDFGSTYPTYGFIYDRADRGTMLASAPATGRSAAVLSVDELNEASARHVGVLSTDPNLITDSPSRGLR